MTKFVRKDGLTPNLARSEKEATTLGNRADTSGWNREETLWVAEAPSFGELCFQAWERKTLNVRARKQRTRASLIGKRYMVALLATFEG